MIIQTFDYNKYENKHLNNRKGTNGFQNIFCPQGTNKYKRTGFNILGFLFCSLALM